MEFNKIFAAILTAGLVAMMSSFISRKVIHPEVPEKPAYLVAGMETETPAAAAPTGPEPILALLASADVAKGQNIAKACAACHSFDKGGPNKVGPNMYNIVGGKKAHMDSFSYSSALAAKGGVWGYDELNHFLYKPKDYIQGTKMSYAGLKKPEERAAVIAYLRSLSDNPAPLPSAADIAAETAAK